MNTFVMIDTETLALTPDAVVLSIGAVAYTAERGIFSRFEAFPNLDMQIKAGRRIDADTLTWWFKQSNEAREEVSSATRYAVPGCARDLLSWVQFVSSGPTYFMANGTDFDLPILTSLFEGTQMPWDGRSGYKQKLCWRTLYNLYKAEIEFPTNATKHSALADAEAQGLAHLSLIAKRPYMA
jgi:hypothetical protein